MTPALATTWRAPRPHGVVLLLHGASRPGPTPASRWGASALRMLPVAAATVWAGRGRVSVLRLVHGNRGWGSGASSADAAARWALEQIRHLHPGVPVAVIGHSLGARAALHVADAPAVAVVVGLAPWITPTEPARLLTRQRVVLLHGSDDRTTSPAATATLVHHAQGIAASATLVRYAGQGHTLLGHGDAAGRLAAHVAVSVLTRDGTPPPRSSPLLKAVLAATAASSVLEG
jgi:alpha-beta hydrolase superfamily lysophospholipase